MTLGAVLHAEVIAEIDTLVGTDAIDDWDVEAIETAARRQTMWVAARRRRAADQRRHVRSRWTDSAVRLRAASAIRRTA